MEIELNEAISALLGSIIGAIAAIGGTLIASYTQKEMTKEQEAKKFFIEEALDRFICRVNFELIGVISILKTSGELDKNTNLDSVIRSNILSPITTFSDVNIHRLNELHPILFQRSIDILEALIEIKIAASQLIVLSQESGVQEGRIKQLQEQINREKSLIEESILKFGKISTILSSKGFTPRKLKKTIKTIEYNLIKGS